MSKIIKLTDMTELPKARQWCEEKANCPHICDKDCPLRDVKDLRFKAKDISSKTILKFSDNKTEHFYLIKTDTIVECFFNKTDKLIKIVSNNIHEVNPGTIEVE